MELMRRRPRTDWRSGANKSQLRMLADGGVEQNPAGLSPSGTRSDHALISGQDLVGKSSEELLCGESGYHGHTAQDLPYLLAKELLIAGLWAAIPRMPWFCSGQELWGRDTAASARSGEIHQQLQN